MDAFFVHGEIHGVILNFFGFQLDKLYGLSTLQTSPTRKRISTGDKLSTFAANIVTLNRRATKTQGHEDSRRLTG
jgi:hypothetical protein